MKRLIALAICGVAVAIAACASTTFTSTWKAPDAKAIDPTGRKVAAVFISNDESGRRVAEDRLVEKLKEHGADGVAAYMIIPTDALRDLDRVRASLAEHGVEGVVIMRVIGEKERVSYSPPRPTFAPYYWRFSYFWPYSWGVAYTPPEVRTDTILSMETLVYSLDDDKLLWAGTTRTVNPDEVDELVAEVADAAAKQMSTQGLLANADLSPRRS